MKWLAVPFLLIAATASQADAGGFSFRFGFGIPHRVKHRHRDHACHCHRTWVRGHYEIVRKRVWVPPHYETVRVKPRYGYYRDACGNRVRYVVRRGYKRNVYHRGHWEVRHTRVWHKGHWSYTCNTPGHRH